MAQYQQQPGTSPEPQGFWNRWHQRAGWAIGVAVPFIAPYFPVGPSAPQGTLLYFEFAGVLAGWFGFGTGWLLWSRIKGWSIVLVWLATAIALAGAIYFNGEYAVLLWGAGSDTNAEEWQMLRLFALTYLCVFFVASFVYWAGGKLILEKLVRV